MEEFEFVDLEACMPCDLDFQWTECVEDSDSTLRPLLSKPESFEQHTPRTIQMNDIVPQYPTIPDDDPSENESQDEEHEDESESTEPVADESQQRLLKQLLKYCETLAPMINKLQSVQLNGNFHTGTLTPLKAYHAIFMKVHTPTTRCFVLKSFLAGIQYFPELSVYAPSLPPPQTTNDTMEKVLSKLLWGRKAVGIRNLTRFVINNHAAIISGVEIWKRKYGTGRYVLWTVLMSRCNDCEIVRLLLEDVRSVKSTQFWHYFFYFIVEFSKLFVGALKSLPIGNKKRKCLFVFCFNFRPNWYSAGLLPTSNRQHSQSKI